MHGRVVRLLVTPLLRALMKIYPDSEFLRFLVSFRYPLSGEFSLTRNLARTNRIPSDWGRGGDLPRLSQHLLETCVSDGLCRLYEHKHQDFSIEEKNAGLMRMATDILTTIYRTLASQVYLATPFYVFESFLSANGARVHSAICR